MSADRPLPHLLDLLRGRDVEQLAPLVLKITDAAMDESHTPVDLQTAAIATAAILVVELNRPDRLRSRERDAEQLFRKFLRAFQARHRELGTDHARLQLDMQSGLLKSLREAWPIAVDAGAIPSRFAAAGVKTAEGYRHALMSNDLQHALQETFARLQLDHSADYGTLVMATLAAAGCVIGGAYADASATGGEDFEAFAQECADDFKRSLLQVIAYWRKKGAS